MKHYPILSQVNDPADLRVMSYDELAALSGEVRDFLITHVAKTGGHLASNLGVVELTLALHRVFDTPEDSLIWDVGHQCYTHKILTGRRDTFDTLRQPGGISGFPKPAESPYDAFITGHSTTSISVAYAIACANKQKGSDRHSVAVIGDGAFTGGMAYEALNNAGRSNTNLVIVLNHNAMSISRNVGAFARYLAMIRSKPSYLRLKARTETVLDHIPLVGDRMKEALRSSKSLLKFILYHATFFEEMGFAYFGPVDGHDLPALEQTLRRAKSLHQPALVYVETRKGKGYEYAEKDPSAYHGIGGFDVETGNPDVSSSDSFSAVFGRELTRLAERDQRICAITAAMKAGTGLSEFASRHRNRFYDVGIAEQHAVTFGAGLASQGLLPVVAVYSTFLQRAYDQILHDAAIGGLHVVLAVDRAGLVGDDGETHQGIYDVAFLGSIPGVTLFAPATNKELEAQLSRALYRTEGVTAIRYPRGCDPELTEYGPDPAADYWLQEKGGKLLAVSYGRTAAELYEAVKEVPEADFLKLNRLFPLDVELIRKIACYERILVFEEAERSGSVGERLCLSLAEAGFSGGFREVSLPDGFIPQGRVPELLKKYHLDRGSMKTILAEEETKLCRKPD